MMKPILYCNRGFAPLREGFEAAGHPVIEVATLPAAGDVGDIAFVLCCMYDLIKRPLQAHRLCATLNRRGIPVVVWNRDGPANKGEKPWRLWLLDHLCYFNIYATHTTQEHLGADSELLYLPNAAWTRHYHLGERTLASLRDIDSYAWDVSFFGRISAARYPEMALRDAFFRELAAALDVRGIRYCFREDSMDVASQRDFIQRSLININFHAGCDTCYNRHVPESRRERSWGLPERCYGVPACGGLLLSDARHHGPQDFHGEGEWQSFTDVGDCVQRIESLLADVDQLRTLAERQYQRVQAEHTYDHRARQVLAAVAAWQAAHPC